MTLALHSMSSRSPPSRSRLWFTMASCAGAALVLGSHVYAVSTSGRTLPPSTSDALRGRGFLPNRGQWKTDDLYVARLPGLILRAEPAALGIQAFASPGQPSDGVYMRWVFEGASTTCTLVPEELGESVYSWFVGRDPAQWVNGARAATRLRWHGLYEGIDFLVREENGSLKFELELQPGADLGQVRVRCEGIEELAVDRSGALLLSTALGCFTEEPPLSCEVLASGKLRPISCSYLQVGPNAFGFETSAREPGSVLWIDPPLVWSTYFGGGVAAPSGLDWGCDVALDRVGDVYVTGHAATIDFPATPGAYHHASGAGSDCFAAKFRGSDGALVYSGVFGGSDNQERGTAITVTRQGKAIVGGFTWSQDFPVTPGAYDTTYQSVLSAGYVLELAPDGGQLLWSTFLMGDAPARVLDLAVGADGAPVAVGSTNVGFPVSSGALDANGVGPSEGFITKLDPGGSQLVWSTYFGGSNYDEINSVALDDQDTITVAGRTASHDFQTTPGVYAPDYPGTSSNTNAFVSRISATGVSLVWSTFLGGNQEEAVSAVDLTPDGGAIVAGGTLSVDFPLTAGAPGQVPTQGFLSRFSPDGSTLVYSTYIGQPSVTGGFAVGSSLSVDHAGIATVAGNTIFVSMTAGSFDTTHNGSSDVGLFRFSPDGSKIYYSTYLGGSGEDLPTSVAATDSGRVTITGRTLSSNYPTTPGAYSPSTHGGSEVFLTTLEPYLEGVQPYHGGTPSCHAPLVTNATEMPRAGASGFGLYVGSAPRHSRGVCLVASAPSATGIPFGNSTLWVDTASLVRRVGVFTDAIGFAEAPLPLGTGTVGLQLWAQFLVREAADCNAASFVTSPALHLTVQ